MPQEMAHWENKAKRLKANFRHPSGDPDRWCGTGGEDAFELWLKMQNEEFKKHTEGYVKDFLVRQWVIDVKTLARKEPVQEKYSAEVHKDQALKKDSPVNAYVFASLDKVHQTIHLVGWMRRKEFLERARELPVGTKKSNGFEVKVGDVPPLELYLYQLWDISTLLRDDLFWEARVAPSAPEKPPSPPSWIWAK